MPILNLLRNSFVKNNSKKLTNRTFKIIIPCLCEDDILLALILIVQLHHLRKYRNNFVNLVEKMQQFKSYLFIKKYRQITEK